LLGGSGLKKADWHEDVNRASISGEKERCNIKQCMNRLKVQPVTSLKVVQNFFRSPKQRTNLQTPHTWTICTVASHQKRVLKRLARKGINIDPS
jgi:hypothetical protein